ncbi:hypothetical protein Bhyg_13336, partial [Pseudolycoriella hygida]
MENLTEIRLREGSASKYLATIRRIRRVLDEVEDIFLRYPEIDFNIYKKFEKDVVDANSTYIEEFVTAYGNCDIDSMNSINERIIEKVIQLSA